MNIHMTRGYGLFESLLAKQRAEKANKLIPTRLRSGRVLDIGCGVFPHFLMSTQFREKYGVDESVNKNFVKDKSITIKKINVGKIKLPFKEKFFDVVVMLAVFEHIEEKVLPAVLKEVNRVLNNNGVLIITTPSPWSKIPLWLFSRLRLVSKHEIDDHKHAFYPKAIKSYISGAGFSGKKIKSGFFETFMNSWFIAKK